MVAYLRLDYFVRCANQGFSLHSQNKSLVADDQGVAVSLRNIPKNSSQAVCDQNRRTWKIFRESLVGTIGQDKFDWICSRYRSRINYSRMEGSGKPLLPEHVELFSIGSSQLLSRDIKRRFREKLSSLTREELRDKMGKVQPFPIVGNYKDPTKIHGAPGSFSAFFFHDKLLMDKEKQLLFSDVGRLTFHSWKERLAKVTVNRELLEGQLIPAPGQDGRIDYYKVYRKIATGDGLVAYGLRPVTRDSTLKPLIVFRPSQWAISNEDAIETYLNDVHVNIGEKGWEPSKPHFDQLMSDPKFRRGNEIVAIAGYSLGGAHAQRFLEFYYADVSKADFYSDPSIDNATAERIRMNINAMPRRAEPLNMEIFRTKGDLAHYVGDKHAGCGVVHPDVNIQLRETDHENKKISVLSLHSNRIFDNNVFRYRMQCVENKEQLFNHLDNSRRVPEIIKDVIWYEKIRRLWGGVAYCSFSALSELIKFVSWIFGVKILRSSRDPEL
jgi:hypothetical protein